MKLKSCASDRLSTASTAISRIARFGLSVLSIIAGGFRAGYGLSHAHGPGLFSTNRTMRAARTARGRRARQWEAFHTMGDGPLRALFRQDVARRAPNPLWLASDH